MRDETERLVKEALERKTVTVKQGQQAKRILVVEDEVMIAMLLEDMLGELGYTVAAEAARIDEALEVTKREFRPCDPRRRSQRPARLAGCRCPRCPRHAIRLCHGLWRAARVLSRPADADEAHPSGRA